MNEPPINGWISASVIHVIAVSGSEYEEHAFASESNCPNSRIDFVRLASASLKGFYIFFIELSKKL